MVEEDIDLQILVNLTVTDNFQCFRINVMQPLNISPNNGIQMWKELERIKQQQNQKRIDTSNLQDVVEIAENVAAHTKSNKSNNDTKATKSKYNSNDNASNDNDSNNNDSNNNDSNDNDSNDNDSNNNDSNDTYTPQGQKSTQSEINAFLQEVEGKTGHASTFWESKPNTQLLARLSNIGSGNLSFYTGKKTLLIQGRDGKLIRETFVTWRAERYQKLQQEEEQRLQEEFEEEEEEKRLQQLLSKSKRSHATSSSSSSSFSSLSSFKKSKPTPTIPTIPTISTLWTCKECTYKSNTGSHCICGSTNPTSTTISKPKKSIEKNCQHCNRLVSKHSRWNDALVCHYSGTYQCGCGRKWTGLALKVQHLSSQSTDAFPATMHPDCKKCKENYTVKLIKHVSPLESRSNGYRPRPKHKHMKQNCQLCKRGKFCPRVRR